VLNTLVRARAVDSCSHQGVCCVCVWRPSANERPYRQCVLTGFAAL